jgi:glyoxylase-like metal-dependent hydrolase (beta-lactamase superfamily II)
VSTAFRAGSFDCRLIADGGGFLPADVVFANAPASARKTALGDRLGPDGRLTVEYGCLLVQGPNPVVLIDTGIGAYEHPLGGRGGEIGSHLDTAGVSRDDVQLVILTHGHLDHIGGLCIEGRPRFPDARHVISQLEWDWLSEDDNPVAREQLAPLEQAGILEFVEGAVDLVAGIRLLPAPGHTPGQLAVAIGGPGGALYLADVVIDELHFEHPNWTMSFDEDSDLNVGTRNALFELAAAEDRVVAAAHVPTPGTIERVGAGFRFAALRA